MEKVSVKNVGLFTDPNRLNLPDGALIVADNVVIDRPDVVDSRRGFKAYATLTSNADKLFVYQSRIIAKQGTTLKYDSDGAGTMVAYAGTYAPPSGASNIRSMEASKNFYLTTSAGVKKLTAYNGTIGMAGMYKGLDGTGATSGASGWFSNNASVGYRVVWGVKDANGSTIVGAPSQRIVVTNTSGGTRNVDLTFTIPSGVTTSYFYQVYRTNQTAASADDPGDETYLAVEKSPSSAEITAGTVTFSDTVPDNMRDALLYTSPSQEGLIQGNEPPPMARDVCFFKNMAFYFNTVSKQRMLINLYKVGGAFFISGDTIIINGVTYTGGGVENIATGTFQVFTAGTDYDNVNNTANSLCRVINRYTSNTGVYAYYLSTTNDNAGQILIEERGVGGAAFTATSSKGSAFSPSLPSSGSTYASSNDSAPQRVFISKQGQPEAVPLGNYIDIGITNKNVLRAYALRDSVVVLKEDGYYRITGETPETLSVTLADTTITAYGDEASDAVANRVIAYTTKGVVSISDSAVDVIGDPIHSDLVKLSAPQFTYFVSVSQGFSYESDTKFYLATVTEKDDTVATQVYVFNFNTGTWTRWPEKFAHGVVNPGDNKLYVASSDTAKPYIYVERKNFLATDYADREVQITLSTYSGKTVNVASTTGVSVGWTLAQLNAAGRPVRQSVIASVDSSTAFTTEESINWDLSSPTAYAYEPISYSVEYAPVHCGDPGTIKHFTTIAPFFTDTSFESMEMSISTDVSPSPEDVEVYTIDDGPWGMFPFGGVAWGGDSKSPQPVRTLVTRDKCRAAWLNVKFAMSQALKSFGLSGFSLFFKWVSPNRK